MKKYKLIVFDMDGTILNTLEDLKDSLNFALSACGFPTRSLEEVRNFVGNGIRNLMERGVPDNTSPSEIDRVHQLFLPHYKEHCYDKTRPYDGINELIANLRKEGFLTACVSNKDDMAVQALCEIFYPKLFNIALGVKEGIRRKPFPDMVNNVLKELKVKTSEAIYIGDSEVDIMTAKNSGLNSLIVTWGFRDKETLIKAGGTTFADSPQEVLTFLTSK